MSTSPPIESISSSLRPLLDALPEPALLIEQSGAVVAANAAWSELAPEEAPGGAEAPPGFRAGEPWLAELGALLRGSEASQGALAEALRSVTSGERARADVEHTYQRGGEPRWVRLTISRFLLGGVDGALVQARDVTEVYALRRKQADLEDSEARMRLLVGAASESLFLTERGRIVEMNPAALHVFGYTREQMSGMNGLDVVAPESRELVTQRMMGNVPGVYEATLLRRDGSTFYAELTGNVVEYQGRTIRGTAIRDVTIEHQAKEVLRQTIAQEEQLRAQAAAIAELSTPLIPISESVMVMPLVGAVDSQRAARVLEALLGGIQASGAKVAILDITGVPAVDAHVAEALLRSARAVRLIGAEVVLTGIRPEVAQTLVALGADLSGITTRGTLRSGIAYATRLRG